MAKSKKTVAEAVKSAVTKKQLLRNASTGEFYEGTAPKGKSPSGTNGGVSFWEV